MLLCGAFWGSGEPVHALVATARDASSQAGSEQLVGLVHWPAHRSTTRLHDVCYLQDLFVALPEHRGQRIAADLIAAVYTAAGERPDVSLWRRAPRFLAGWMGSQGDNPMAAAIGAKTCEARRPRKRCGACWQGETSGPGSSRVDWTTHTTNTSGRAARDKLAKHAGFIVYSHEL
ncbi:MAG: hypothetical protein ACKO1L_05895 [Brachymonas sp.]